jgi:hypothetical protein
VKRAGQLIAAIADPANPRLAFWKAARDGGAGHAAG